MLYINCNNFYEYTNCKSYYDHTKVLKIKYDCFDYNEDIVSSFESSNFEGVNYEILNDEQIQQNQENNIYSNNAAINIFIKDQLAYLDSLPLYQKRIIQDYTRINTTFHFYELFKNQKPHYNTFRWFSDGFFTQIYKLYNEKHAIELSDLYFSHLQIKRHNNDWFKHWLEHDRVEDFRDREYGVPPAVYKHATITPFATANFIDWDKVLTKFISDITFLILKAPEVKETIYGYRGVSGHYIHENQDETYKSTHIAKIRELMENYKKTDTKKQHAYNQFKQLLEADNFLNLRLSSITFDFKISKFFHDKFRNENSAIYKSSINKGCKVLLISPLSMFYQEFEIITPPYSITMYIDESHEDDSINHSTSNNIDTKYGICIKQEFKTYHNILTKTPMTYTEYLQMPNIISAKTPQHSRTQTSAAVNKAAFRLSKGRLPIIKSECIPASNTTQVADTQPIIVTRVADEDEDEATVIKQNAEIIQSLTSDNVHTYITSDRGDIDKKIHDLIVAEQDYLEKQIEAKHLLEIEKAKKAAQPIDHDLDNKIDDDFFLNTMKKRWVDDNPSTSTPNVLGINIDISLEQHTQTLTQEIGKHADKITNTVSELINGLASRF